MKKNKLLIIFNVLLFTLFSCEKEGDSYDISEETIFPDIEYEQSVVIQTGETFTPEATAKEGETVLDYTVTGSVDNTTPGVYTIIYSAENSDGYEKTSEQTVVVYDPSIVGTDVSGSIQDANNNSRKGAISLVEGTTNIFYGSDMGFAGVFPLYFQMNGDVATVVPQSFLFWGLKALILPTIPDHKHLMCLFTRRNFLIHLSTNNKKKVVMKKLHYIAGILLVFNFYSCEQEEIDPGKVKSNAMSGEWFVLYNHPVYGDDPFQVGYTRIITSSTAAESENEMIITDESNFWDYRIKCSFNEATNTFGGNDTLINYVSGYDIKVLVRNGQIIPDAVSLASGVMADSIYFELWFEDLEDATGIPGDTLLVSGYRRTGFLEDEHLNY
ncbi:MAG: DUF5011 domain-containing protein [Bacteroidales bacterium]|nr:DUF5011 domain-containing protein [Bacteroidales bacterium]